MVTALITGSGFCAKHLARRLYAEGDIRVVGASFRKEPPVDVYFDEYFQMDVRDPCQVATVVRRSEPELVFHLAGLTNGSVEDVYRTNVLGSVHLLESVHIYAPQARILLIGSAAEYGLVDRASLPVTENHLCRPVGPYGVSKHAMTLAGLDYARRFGMKVVVARPFNIVGAGVPSSLLVGAVLRRAKHAMQAGADRVVKVGNLDTERDFVAVNDAVEAYVRMVRGDFWGEVFNICSGQPRSVSAVVSLLLSHSDRPIRYEVDHSLVRPSDIKIVFGDWEKANRAFGFRPATSLEESIRAAWAYEMEGVD